MIKINGNRQETVKALNNLARLKLREKILKDLACDLMIGKIEGWDSQEYIKDLKDEIDLTYKKVVKDE